MEGHSRRGGEDQGALIHLKAAQQGCKATQSSTSTPHPDARGFRALNASHIVAGTNNGDYNIITGAITTGHAFADTTTTRAADTTTKCATNPSAAPGDPDVTYRTTTAGAEATYPTSPQRNQKTGEIS